MSFIQKSFLAIGLFLLSMVIFNNNANASHVAGGYINFECTGTPGQYKVTLILYRDCSGIPLDTYNKTVYLSNNCGINRPSISLSYKSKKEVSQVCLNDQNNTTCKNSNNPVHGYEEYIFSAIVTLPPCNGWTGSYDLAARNTTVNVPGSASTNFHVTSTMNSATDNCNTSPTVTSQPEPYVCIGQPVSYNLGAYEPDGDSIVYTLVPATDQNNTNLTYGFGYNATSPIPGASINPQTGTVTFTPNTLGAFIFVIRITEYDSNGNILTQTNYEYQTYVMNCSNQQPVVGGTGGIQNPTGSIVQEDANTLKLCQGLQGCFDVVFQDPDAGDNLSITSNLAMVLPGATITQTGTNPLTVHVCWTPTTTTGTVTLNFIIEDDACPITGQNNYAAAIQVILPGVANVATTTEDCLGDDGGTATLTVTGGSAPTSFQITGPKNEQNTTGVFQNLPPGTYNYNIETDAGGCPLTNTFTINPGPALVLTGSGTDAVCNGEANGSATAAPNGQAAYSYVWTGGVAAGQTTQTASNLPAGTYTVAVTDSRGCSNSVNIIVGQPAVLTGTANPTDATCFGGATGSINLTGVGGGNGSYQYSIDGGTYGPGVTFPGLSQGSHVVRVKDALGCILPLTVTVGQPTALNLTLVSTGSATCGTNSGNISVTATGGTPGTPAYSYSTGSQTNTTGVFPNMAPGSHTITVTDANGCTDDLIVPVGAVGAPTAFLDTKTDLQCFGANNGKAVIGVSGTVGTVTYALNGGTPQNSNVFNNLAVGPYSVDIVDGNGCPANVTFNITEPAQLQYTSTPANVKCGGDCDGEIVIAATGGTITTTGDYHYSSNNGATFSTSSPLTGLCEGPILVVIKDDNGCQANSTVMIGAPDDITADFNLSDPKCRNGSDGEIEVVNVLGGTPNFQYKVDGEGCDFD